MGDSEQWMEIILKEHSRPNSAYCCCICLEALRNTTKNLRLVCVLEKNWTRLLLDIGQKHYCFSEVTESFAFLMSPLYGACLVQVTSATWRTQTRHFSLKSQGNSGRSVWNMLHHLIKCSWFWSVDFLFRPSPRKESRGVPSGLDGIHSVRPWFPIYGMLHRAWSAVRRNCTAEK